MMNGTRIIVVFGLLLCIGCKEFIEPSLDKKKVVLLAPALGTETGEYTQTFWWEEVEDASSYRLQVVSPTFEHPAKLLLDTLLKTSKFLYSVDPGTYEWRVRAENGSSQSPYSSSSFIVYPTSISQQQVQLESPENTTITNQPTVSFKWHKILNANQYQIQIDTNTNSFEDSTTLVVDKTTSNLNYSISFVKDKTYKWLVRALSASEYSKWSVISSLTLDATPPEAVPLVSPANNSTNTNPVSLKWNSVAKAKKYLLYLYKDEAKALYNTTFPLQTTNLSYSFNSGRSGEQIYWEVRSVDEAGNISAPGEIRKFSLQ